MPESIRFWLRRIETSDPDKSFSIGLIYGPSGCGKSSLVKAGLLPRLADRIESIYLEASAEGTEAHLLRALRCRHPRLNAEPNLIDALAALRRTPAPDRSKTLIVIDQFEQWLHGRRSQAAADLVLALRHCDGEHVQAIMLVRDDFWMATMQFLRELEVQAVDGKNAAAVDLFDLRHARKVLTAYGRAFGALPEDALTKPQQAFLERAVQALAQDDKVISVRLSLFAEMVKGYAWEPETLRNLGGPAGVGVAFLEQCFGSATAPQEMRVHQMAGARFFRSCCLNAERT